MRNIGHDKHPSLGVVVVSTQSSHNADGNYVFLQSIENKDDFNHITVTDSAVCY